MPSGSPKPHDFRKERSKDEILAAETSAKKQPDFFASPYVGHSIAAVPSHLLDPQHKVFINTKHTSGRELPLYFESILPQTSFAPQPFSSPLLSTSLTQKLALHQQRDHDNGHAVPSCLLPTPVRPSNAVLLSESRARGQSVSFCDPDGAEKSRRFTISAQPLSANLNTGSRQTSFQALPQRKVSLTGESHRAPSRSGSTLAFQVASRCDIPQDSSLASSRAQSPVLDHAASILDTNFSPSPPSMKSAASFNSTPFKTSPITSNGYSTFSPDLPPTLSGRSSRQGSDVGTQPITILRKNSQSKKSNKTLVASPVGPPVPFQEFLLKEDDKKVHILLACTGSVATIKVPLIIDRLFQIFGTSKISVQLVVTKCAGHFLKGLKIRKDVKIWRDEDEWANFSEWNLSATTTLSTCETKKHKNPHEKMILHNELRKWADIMLLAPLSANTLAKIAHGISDNLLTSIIRSWGILLGASGQAAFKKPILVAPAMNTFMYTHPLTAKQLKILALNEEGFGMEVLKPVEKVLVCGDIGMGGMREWLDIVETMRKKIKSIFAERQAAEGVPMSLDERDDEDGDDDEDDKNEDDEDDDEDDDDDDDDDEDDDDDDDDEDDEDDDDDDDKSSRSIGRKSTVEGIFGPAECDEESLINEPKTPKTRTSTKPTNEDIRGTISAVSEEAKTIL